MPKKSTAFTVPKPKACSKCGSNKWDYQGKHMAAPRPVELDGYLWKCKCGNVEFVKRVAPKK